MKIPFLKGVKELKCQGCGNRYPMREFEKICYGVQDAIDKFVPYPDLLLCLVCFKKKYSDIVL